MVELVLWVGSMILSAHAQTDMGDRFVQVRSLIIQRWRQPIILVTSPPKPHEIEV